MMTVSRFVIQAQRTYDLDATRRVLSAKCCNTTSELERRKLGKRIVVSFESRTISEILANLTRQHYGILLGRYHTLYR